MVSATRPTPDGDLDRHRRVAADCQPCSENGSWPAATKGVLISAAKWVLSRRHRQVPTRIPGPLVHVSAQALCHEPEALKQLDAKVAALDLTRTITSQPQVIVLAAAGRKWTADSLFTRSQTALLRLQAVRAAGSAIQFADTPYSPKRKRRTPA
jgi:hypothetical protein